jgi:hypothetical protein
VPSKSKKQHNFMEMIAHSPKMAKKAGVPQAVGKEFAAADKGKSFKSGGNMAAKKFDPKKLFKGKESVGEELKEAKAIKSGKITPMQYAKGEKSEPVKKMAAGGLGIDARRAANVERESATPVKAPVKAVVKNKKPEDIIVDKITKGQSPVIPKNLTTPPVGKKAGGSCYRAGGFVRAADGVATKGKTKGRFC